MFERLPVRPVVVRSSAELAPEASRSLANCELIVDAILGTGFTPPVEGFTPRRSQQSTQREADRCSRYPVGRRVGFSASAIRRRHGARRCDCDVHCTTPGACLRRADAWASRRCSHRQPRGGDYLISESGGDGSARDLSRLLAPRPMDSNKGRYGHALIVGGSLGKSGAAAMAGMAVLRAGAGLSTVAVPESVLPSVASFAAELMTEPLPETRPAALIRRRWSALSSWRVR